MSNINQMYDLNSKPVGSADLFFSFAKMNYNCEDLTAVFFKINKR